ncbi:amidohydrolase [Rhizobium rhizosphaerae]|uniref:Amidohydrolase n=1 Tax=Xaviernesmea rhizosphaerae TaxID=1672749 RepID=A0A1Q9ADA6_9HYPH|nr:carbon-nitrogen hydrolase family protein [Xaviernesmea rhizosphaerae]OLP52902.1 amidohydrolase [Xaviernesmea rhizosphaerae]
MTRNAKLKRRVRSRCAKTGESYTAALRHFRHTHDTPGFHSFPMAVAQTRFFDDPSDLPALRASGAEMRDLMNKARLEGARLLHFPEGTLCSPNKRIMSSLGRREIGPSDWSRCNWDAFRTEIEAIRALAGQLKLWTVFGAAHRLSEPHRPHNSLYVISDRGDLVTRYDERLLSNTKISFMYSPGKRPVTFEVDGFRFGCSLGMELHYPEVFIDYEQRDVDCVLFSTTGESPQTAFAAEALGHAASNSYWLSFSAHTPQSIVMPSGIADPAGQWAARCPHSEHAVLAMAHITIDPDSPAKPWRRKARSGLYAAFQIDGDPRSDETSLF